MKYKIFLNNPNRAWIDTETVWLTINNKYSMPYKKNELLTWPSVHAYMKKKYPQYTEEAVIGNLININLSEDPFADKTGNQTVVTGTEEGQQEALFTNT